MFCVYYVMLLDVLGGGCVAIVIWGGLLCSDWCSVVIV
jgi:hypothetical protein